MIGKGKNYLTVFITIFVVALFVIFFVGKKVDPATGKSYFALVADGYNYFRKGLDISGGVKLTYKVDYSKYKELYPMQQEFLDVRARVESIILKNIDTRISTLGVSDYTAYPQQLNDDYYIIVELGGVQNIDQAKDMIGKTVELEFKLPNEGDVSPTSRAQRQLIAEQILTQALQNPDAFMQLGQGRQSDEIFVNNFVDAPLDQLPDIYQAYISRIEKLQSGQVFGSLVDGDYIKFESQDELGAITGQTLNGFAIVQFIKKKIVELQNLTSQRVELVAKSYGLTMRRSASLDSDTGVSYNKQSRTVTAITQQILPNQKGFDVQVYKIGKGLTIGRSAEEVAKQNEYSSMRAQEILNALRQGRTPAPSDDFQNIKQGWITESELRALVANLPQELTKSVEVYDLMDGFYVVAINNIKEANQTLFEQFELLPVTQAQSEEIMQALKTQALYTINDIFVRDRVAWTTAIDPKTSEILNGAYFRFASVDRSSIGKPVVTITFDDKGKQIFCNITEQAIGKKMAIFIGGQLVTSPVINDKICGGSAQIDGSFTVQTAKEMVDNLNAGALPAALILAQEEKISATLGDTALRGALIAALVGIIIIAVMMLIMYGPKKMFISILSLTIFLTILLAVAKMIDYAFSLSGIAALILTIGMGVDVNILIFERLREEFKSGKSAFQAIDIAYERSLAPIRDGNLSTGLIAFLFFTMGVSIFKGFGAMMLITMILMLFINVPLTKDLLHLFYDRKRSV